MMVDEGAIERCDTIEELEQQLGLEAGMLTSNVEKWNAACDAGEDYATCYKYPKEWLIRIDEPPFYGAKLGGHVFGSKTGLRVTHMQVVDVKGKPIEGLYAGWHTAGGSAGDGNPAGKPLTGMYADLGLSVRRRLHGSWRHHGPGRQNRSITIYAPPKKKAGYDSGPRAGMRLRVPIDLKNVLQFHFSPAIRDPPGKTKPPNYARTQKTGAGRSRRPKPNAHSSICDLSSMPDTPQ